MRIEDRRPGSGDQGLRFDKLSLTGRATLPRQAKKILVWHQGALGDVLLAGPALQAVAAHYPGARFTGVGNPEQFCLLAPTQPLAAAWTSQRPLWLGLFQDGGSIDPELQKVLSGFDLALVFSPRRQPVWLERLLQAGIPEVFWLPSFPVQERIAISRLQGERLLAAGIQAPRSQFRLAIPEAERRQARDWLRARTNPGTPLVALAPGSGHPKKNWPLEAYNALARGLEKRYGAQVWWVLGPAETGKEAAVPQACLDQGGRFLKNLPLSQLAAILAEFQLYVGNDSGVTHLAALVGGPTVAAIFGPSDPAVWAPPGDRTLVITSDLSCSPCTLGREIACPKPVCLSSLTPEKVLAGLILRWRR